MCCAAYEPRAKQAPRGGEIAPPAAFVVLRDEVRTDSFDIILVVM